MTGTSAILLEDDVMALLRAICYQNLPATLPNLEHIFGCSPVDRAQMRDNLQELHDRHYVLFTSEKAPDVVNDPCVPIRDRFYWATPRGAMLIRTDPSSIRTPLTCY